jgi:hypothetical protein
MRLLLEPSPESGGGQEATPAPATTATPTPTPASPPTPAEPAAVSVSAEEYRKFLEAQSKLAEVEAEKERAKAEAAQREIEALEKKGEAEAAKAKQKELSDAEIKKRDEKLATVEAELLTEKKANIITGCLLGTDFLSVTAAAHAREHLENRLESLRDATGKVVVREKGTNKSADVFIKEWLASADESGHYRKASTTGGAGATGADRTTTTGEADRPLTFAEKAIAREKNRLHTPNGTHYGLARGAN